MPGRYFISYSDSDAKDFGLRLHDALESTTDLSVWLDKLDLPPGRDWASGIADGIRDCDVMPFVMTTDSIRDTNNCKKEIMLALSYKKPIVPLHLHQVDLPFLINTRQWIPFDNFDRGMAKLREHIRWRATPDAALQDLKDRLADAERDFDRGADPNARARIEDDITLLQKQIAEQERVVANPQAAAQRTEQSIERAIEREREPAKPVSGITRTKFINALPDVKPYFKDRYEENKRVKKFLEDDTQHLLTIVGRAGIGKTAMVCRILKSLESGRMPDDLGEMKVDGIVYLSNAIGVRVVNVPNLFADLSKLLPDDKARELDALYRDPKVSAEKKMHVLLAAFPSGRVIVLLDNLESVMDAEAEKISDAELDEALRAMLNAPHHAVKVIATTRIAPHDLLLFQPAQQDRLNIDDGLEPKFAKQVLIENDADGRLSLKNAADALLDRACDYTRGFPRALEALIAILRADRYTTLEEILARPHRARKCGLCARGRSVQSS